MKHLRHGVVHVLVFRQVLIYGETWQLADKRRLSMSRFRFERADCLSEFRVIGRPTSRVYFRDLRQLRQIRRFHRSRLLFTVLRINLGLRPQGHQTRLHYVLGASGHRDLLKKVGDMWLQIRSRFVDDVLRQFAIALEILGAIVHEERGVRR